MAYTGGKQFQFSDRFTLSRTTQEIWTTDAGVRQISIFDSIGNRSRVLRVAITDPHQSLSAIYTPMLRVRLLDDFGMVSFLGRVVSVDPEGDQATTIITCRDYLDDLSDRTVEASSTDGLYNGASSSR